METIKRLLIILAILAGLGIACGGDGDDWDGTVRINTHEEGTPVLRAHGD